MPLGTRSTRLSIRFFIIDVFLPLYTGVSGVYKRLNAVYFLFLFWQRRLTDFRRWLFSANNRRVKCTGKPTRKSSETDNVFFYRDETVAFGLLRVPVKDAVYGPPFIFKTTEIYSDHLYGRVRRSQ